MTGKSDADEARARGPEGQARGPALTDSARAAVPIYSRARGWRRVVKPYVVGLVSVLQVMPVEQRRALAVDLLKESIRLFRNPPDLLDMLSQLARAAAGLHITIWSASDPLEQLVMQVGWDGGAEHTVAVPSPRSSLAITPSPSDVRESSEQSVRPLPYPSRPPRVPRGLVP